MAIPRCGIHAHHRDASYQEFKGCTRPENHPSDGRGDGGCRDGDHALTPEYLDALYLAEPLSVPGVVTLTAEGERDTY